METSFLSLDNLNKSVAKSGDIENAQYRKSCFPGYGSWMTMVFSLKLSREETMSLMSEARAKACAIILEYRAIASQDVSQEVWSDEYLSMVMKVAELKKECKQLVRTNQSLVKELDYVKEANVKLTTHLRQALRNNLVTTQAHNIAGKVAKVAKTKIVINIGR